MKNYEAEERKEKKFYEAVERLFGYTPGGYYAYDWDKEMTIDGYYSAEDLKKFAAAMEEADRQ